jgi:EmrB/QacA subfamily drug resistance transporter
MAGMFLSSMDTQIVYVALPTLSRDFHTSLAGVQWTVIGYVLALALWIPASGWIGDRIGTKRTYLYALGLFTLASALCGLSRNLPELIAFRVLQGTGGGMITPVAMAMLWRAYPPSERARLARLMFVPILIAPASAPILGGLLIEHLSWRWVFYVNVPVGAIAVLFAGRYLVEHRESATATFDTAGFFLSGIGLVLVLYAISEGTADGWTSVPIVATAVGGAVVLIAFVRIELYHRDAPILRLRLIEEPLFRATNINYGITIVTFFGVLYLTPVFLQERLGLSPVGSGLTTFVEAFGVVAGTQTIGRLYPRVGPRRLTASGLLGLAVVGGLLSRVGSTTSIWDIRTLMFFSGVVASAALLPLQTAMFTNIASSDSGHASAIFNTERQASNAFGVAVVTTIVAASHRDGFRNGYLETMVVALLGVVASLLLIHDKDAGATMRTAARDTSSDGGAPDPCDGPGVA